MPTMSGARFVAETFKGYGLTHVFYVPSIARRILAELGDSRHRANSYPRREGGGLHG